MHTFTQIIFIQKLLISYITNIYIYIGGPAMGGPHHCKTTQMSRTVVLLIDRILSGRLTELKCRVLPRIVKNGT